MRESEVLLFEEFLKETETHVSDAITVHGPELTRRKYQFPEFRPDKKFFSEQLRIKIPDKKIDLKYPTWACNTKQIIKVIGIQEKLLGHGILKDQLRFSSIESKKDYLKPKIKQVCDLMDEEI